MSTTDPTPAEACGQFLRDAGRVMSKGKGSPDADRQAAILTDMAAAAGTLAVAWEQNIANLLELARLDLPGLDPRIPMAAAQTAALRLLDLEAVLADPGE